MDDVTIDFTAIDFETANGSPASACAVGLVRVRDGRIADRATWLIRPPSAHDEFRPFNVQLHGISREMTRGAQPWERQLPALLAFLGDDVLVAHNARFDIGVLLATSLATQAALPALRYFCSLRLARRSYELHSYRLPVAAEAAGFRTLVHHDPVSDAEASAAIVIDSARRFGAPDLASLAASRDVAIERIELDQERERAATLTAAATFA
ncbi:3'-5' exonuclease [Pseudoclavibacter sp. JSM 162008]|jgi:DNA polymerase-3 subunit epsilon|uniref:3'-5' exonuclease n=1 Tax=Pseudoclavibacter sp. JSM 162008 TaxID=3229855 RepID=UPI0035245CC8